jgi:hypothetical protein
MEQWRGGMRDAFADEDGKRRREQWRFCAAPFPHPSPTNYGFSQGGCHDQSEFLAVGKRGVEFDPKFVFG